MSDLEVRQLRYFVAVAEELHFGRAAERLAMAQPPLSRAIRDLERQLGVRLFERTTRQVSLTPAGEVLLRDARTALDAVNAAGRRAQHAGRVTPALRLALKADYDAGLLPEILSVYQSEAAALPVEVRLGGRAGGGGGGGGGGTGPRRGTRGGPTPRCCRCRSRPGGWTSRRCSPSRGWPRSPLTTRWPRTPRCAWPTCAGGPCPTARRPSGAA